ncbi:GTP-binding protein [candidate division KSB1 bacterium]|nr:GTP-binding protein [candidate division KSB1 bacterium]
MPQSKAGKINKKVCLLGTFAVGKSSLVRQFVYSQFSDDYLSTLGVQLATKSLDTINPETQKAYQVNLILWDLAQVEKFDAVTKTYLHGSQAAIMVFDLTRRASLIDYEETISGFREINPESKIVLAGNKTDLAHTEESRLEIERIAADLSCPVFFTSAKTGENVDALFHTLAQKLL